MIDWRVIVLGCPFFLCYKKVNFSFHRIDWNLGSVSR